jgi:hypothetical protein
VADGKTVPVYRVCGDRLVPIPLRDGNYGLYRAEDPAALISD